MKTTLTLLLLALLPLLPASGGDAPSPEIEKLLDHYRALGDPQKLAAAEFLVANMGEHGYIVAALYDKEKEEIPFDALEWPDLKAATARLDEIEREHGPTDFGRKRFDRDVDTITADFLVENIELAFRAWRERPWAKDVPFDLFLEHLLPYRGSNEPLGGWRKALFAEFADLPSRMADPTDMGEAAKLLRQAVGKKVRFSDLYYVHPTDQSYEEMVASGLGRCEDITNFSTFAFRANAVLSACDYTPHWPNRDNNHAWEVILDREGKGDAGLSNVAAKVYRKTFSIQPGALGSIRREDEKVPRWLAGRTYRDVTRDYVPVSDVTVALAEPAGERRFAYLAVFNGGEWKAIHWARVRDGKAVFTDMGRGIAYLPVFADGDDLSPAGAPFLLRKDGAVTVLSGRGGGEVRVEIPAESGKRYELKVWDGAWKILPAGAAAAPAGRLYWLTAEDGRKLERIFTIEAGRPVHW